MLTMAGLGVAWTLIAVPPAAVAIEDLDMPSPEEVKKVRSHENDNASYYDASAFS
jgi:hypothetical protein